MVTEALAAAELDMQWHTLPANAPLQNVDEFEKAALGGRIGPGRGAAAVPVELLPAYLGEWLCGGVLRVLWTRCSTMRRTSGSRITAD